MNAHPSYLLCTDLDRTLLPNGNAPESPGARKRFTDLVTRSDVALAYVTGRHRALVEQAIGDYALPRPDYVVGDVGSSIYALEDGGWRSWDGWAQEIAPDWGGLPRDALANLFSDLGVLRQQEPEKQSRFKLSYYAAADTAVEELLEEMERRLETREILAALIWSIDETSGTGLLDVLPARATKLHAVEFLMRRAGFAPDRTVFSGDSGNDLPVLASSVQSVLVANASDEVRARAVQMAAEQDASAALYIARGGFMGMNGNYSAGILEGFVHFIPQAAAWLGSKQV